MLRRILLGVSLFTFIIFCQKGYSSCQEGPVSAAKQFSTAFINVAKSATPAVVFIKSESRADDESGMYEYPPNPFEQFGDDFFQKFFGMPHRQHKPQMQASQGSGFIISTDGYIMTNAHVVQGAEKLTVTLHDGIEVNATLLGSDLHTDIAIIKIEGDNYPFLDLGDSDDMEPGEWVVAIGSPFQLQSSVTVGVISAKGRQNLAITNLEDFIQTDAAINPGNSGGPLIDLDGKVIGINTAIVSRSGGYMGIGFAVPSNMARGVKDQLMAKGSVTRGYLGISPQPVDRDIAEAFNLEKPEGVLIAEVVAGSPACTAGLKQGDIIIEINDAQVKSLGAFRNMIALMEPNSVVKMKVLRQGDTLVISATLGKAADDMQAGGGLTQKLGLDVTNVTPDLAKKLGYSPSDEGVVITKVKPGSISAAAGLRPGFLIQAINHQPITNVEEFSDVLGNVENKKRILLLARDGKFTKFYSLRVE